MTPRCSTWSVTGETPRYLWAFLLLAHPDRLLTRNFSLISPRSTGKRCERRMYIRACSSVGLMALVSGTRSLLQTLICKLAGVGGLMRTKVKGCVSPEPMCSIPKQVLLHQTHLQLWPDSYRTYYPDRSSCSCPGLQRRCQLACQTCVRLTYSRTPQGKDILSNPAQFFKSHMLKTSHRVWVHLSLPQGTLQPHESHQGVSPRHRDHPALLPASMWREMGATPI